MKSTDKITINHVTITLLKDLDCIKKLLTFNINSVSFVVPSEIKIREFLRLLEDSTVQHLHINNALNKVFSKVLPHQSYDENFISEWRPGKLKSVFFDRYTQRNCKDINFIIAFIIVSFSEILLIAGGGESILGFFERNTNFYTKINM